LKCPFENDGKRVGMGENVLLFFVNYDMIYVFQGMSCFLLGLRENRDYGIPLIQRIPFFLTAIFQAMNG
jgi:hypothetical protein